MVGIVLEQRLCDGGADEPLMDVETRPGEVVTGKGLHAISYETEKRWSFRRKRSGLDPFSSGLTDRVEGVRMSNRVEIPVPVNVTMQDPSLHPPPYQHIYCPHPLGSYTTLASTSSANPLDRRISQQIPSPISAS